MLPLRFFRQKDFSGAVLVISLIVFAANMFGDALRDFWDPRLKRL